MSWKDELDALLSPRTASEERAILARDLFARSAEIAADVAGAVSAGRPDELLPERLRNDLTSLQRQIEEDLVPQLPGLLEGDGPQSLREAAAAAAAGVSSRGPAAIASLLADPTRAVELAGQGLSASVSRDVEGLDTPSYKLLKQCDGYELRQYASYAVASCDMDASEGDNLVVQMTTGSSAFSALAAYMFGSNGREELLGITTPVRIDVAAPGAAAPSTMSFVLPIEFSAASAPVPIDEEVRLEQIPLQTLAVVEFTGFATAGEVARQKDVLVQQLAADGVEVAVEDGGDVYSVFQYNPPYTLPWLRRNELAIPVLIPEAVLADEEGDDDGDVASASVAAEIVEELEANQDDWSVEKMEPMDVADDSAPSDIEA